MRKIYFKKKASGYQAYALKGYLHLTGFKKAIYYILENDLEELLKQIDKVCPEGYTKVVGDRLSTNKNINYCTLRIKDIVDKSDEAYFLLWSSNGIEL